MGEGAKMGKEARLNREGELITSKGDLLTIVYSCFALLPASLGTSLTSSHQNSLIFAPNPTFTSLFGSNSITSKAFQLHSHLSRSHCTKIRGHSPSFHLFRS